MVGRFRSDDPHFGNFQSDWVPILYIYRVANTLDLGIPSPYYTYSDLICGVGITEPFISHHYVVYLTLNISKPGLSQKTF